MQSYLIFFKIDADTTIHVGRFGELKFASGLYAYIGSAKKTINQRVCRHLSSEKKVHWHIDYVLMSETVRCLGAFLSTLEECQLAQQTGWKFEHLGFGSTDCKAGCFSHLQRVSSLPYLDGSWFPGLTPEILKTELE